MVGVQAASRSYLTGPVAPGRWSVVVGKAQIKTLPATYALTVILRDVATLPKDLRTTYAPAAALARGARWYAGDFHTHSRDSGDARPSLDEMATFATSQGLDFIESSDHNTVSQLDFFSGVQALHPALLLVPGIEYTTYDGHANLIGATHWVDHKIGQPGVTIDAAMTATLGDGALFGINHPELDFGDACIGCAWRHELDAARVGAVEIGTGKADALFGDATIAFWDHLLDRGSHAVPVGGSDDHKAGVGLDALGSPIGTPTTLVYAEELSVAGLLAGLRAGRTVVKLQGAASPMIDLTSSVAAEGDTVAAESTTLTATVTGGDGKVFYFVRDGAPQESLTVAGDPFTATLEVTPPTLGSTRVRAEIKDGARRTTVTSHVFVSLARPHTADATGGGGCGCRVVRVRSPEPWLALSAVALSALLRRRRPRTGS